MVLNNFNTVLVVVFAITKFTSGQQVTNGDSMIIISQCSPEDFEENGQCTLICTLNTVNYTNYEWKYFTSFSSAEDLGKPHELITNGVGILEGPTNTSTTLTLDIYYAGCYVCEFQIANKPDVPVNMIAYTKIDPNTVGSLINGTCINYTDCLALDSQCVQTVDNKKVCECTGDYDIQLINTADTPGCVPHRVEGENCTYDQQCYVYTESFFCTAGVCKCEGFNATVAAKNYDLMCLEPVPLTRPCYYDEQCLIFLQHTICHKTCQCAEGYKVNQDSSNPLEWFCVDSGLTGGAIAGIVIGILAVVAIIAGVVYLIWFK